MTREEAKDWISKKCGDGWLTLVDEIYDNLPHGIKIKSIYQKWGALNFTASPWTDETELIHDHVESKSLEICEICGNEGSEVTIDGWVHTRCPNHQK